MELLVCRATGQISGLWRNSMDDFDYDYCCECRGYGDDYYINYYGEEVCACDDYPRNESNRDDD